MNRNRGSRTLNGAALALLAALTSFVSLTGSPRPDLTIEIARVQSPIQIDGVLDDAAWTRAARIETFFEFTPGDNVEPKVRTVGYLAYDDQYLYAGFDMFDPRPDLIRAPLSDRDDLEDYSDHAGLLIDGTDDGQTAQMFFANPRGIQYDAIMSDSSGEDDAPDFFWDSAAHIDDRGWTLEIRIPFASLRYLDSSPEQWRIILYRNWPRDFQYEITSAPFPRGSHCIVCNFPSLVGLSGLPEGSHWVLAPYISGTQISEPEGALGSALQTGSVEQEIGFDAKWSPTPNLVIDATMNPDFSQIESDAAQITANERFAIFYPERRPFFLEGIDLFSTQIPAVYTRSITKPTWGARATGELGRNTYTILAAEDEGGGSVILPGPRSSDLARQDFTSLVLIGRLRHDFQGGSYASVLYSGREIEGGAYNRVLGPDFRWQPSNRNVVSGQLLFSRSDTPVRPDLAPEWDGRKLSGHAFDLFWQSRSERFDSFLVLTDSSGGFRADNGFVPDVGGRRGAWEGGRSWFPEGSPISNVRISGSFAQSEERDGTLLTREWIPGIEMEGVWDSFARIEVSVAESRGREKLFERTQTRLWLNARPGRLVSEVTAFVNVGDTIDYANDRLGDGVELRLSADLQPSDHLRLNLLTEMQHLDVTTEEGLSGRLFTARIARMRATWTFNARSWVRLIGQWEETERDSRLYHALVREKQRSLATSGVFAWKLNWQSVLYLGWADDRIADDADSLQPAGRQFFAKVSYAFQR